MTENVRWRSRRPCYKAVVNVADLCTLVTEAVVTDARLSLEINPFRKMTTPCIPDDSPCDGNEIVEIRNVDGSFAVETSAAPLGVRRYQGRRQGGGKGGINPP